MPRSKLLTIIALILLLGVVMCANVGTRRPWSREANGWQAFMWGTSP